MPFCRSAMLPAQLANVAAAALPRPPTVETFLGRLSESLKPKESPSAADALFGETFPEDAGKPSGTVKNQKMAYAAAMDFMNVLKTEGVVITDLDEWLTAFAKWGMSLDTLFDDAGQRQTALEQRKAMCARARVAVRSWLPQSMKTVVNALALMYKQTGPEGGIVPGVASQFPRYCRFFNAACTRHRNANARHEPTPVLQDDEVLKLVLKTNWVSWYEAQRMNFLLLAFQLGQRPESLVRLCVGNFHALVLDDGRNAMQVSFGTMKNLQGNQGNVGKAAHKQLMVEHVNRHLCGIAAYKRQIALLGGSPDPASPFFRSARLMTKTAPPNAASVGFTRGLAQWVGAGVGRAVTFKDCARRPVFTRLVNALSVHDAARAVGVIPRTMDKYHVAGLRDVTTRAADVLAQVAPKASFYQSPNHSHHRKAPSVRKWSRGTRSGCAFRSPSLPKRRRYTTVTL